jgi:cysteine desulfurase
MTAYLDNASTTRVCDEAAQAALRVMTEVYGNPSSTHTMGRRAKAVLDVSRAAVAGALGCRAEELFFTSGGTEGDNWAVIRGAESRQRLGKHIISSAVEHDAVRKSLDYLEAHGFTVTRLKPEPDGSIAVPSVLEALRQDTVLISLMLVNNETGAVTDIGGLSKALRAAGSGALLHTDAVQAFLKVPFSADKLGADLISISGHKIHAPKGVGALYIKKGVRLPPLLLGGAQENSLRAGTEALPQIAAFGEAANLGKAAMTQAVRHMQALRELAVSRLTEETPGLQVIGGGAPHILSIALPGYKSEVLMNYLEAEDIFVSKSSACKKGGRSHVLEAMGLPAKVIDGALRVSFSRYTTREEVTHFCTVLKSARENLFTVLG